MSSISSLFNLSIVGDAVCIQANLSGLRRTGLRKVSFGLTRLLTQNYTIGSATALNQYPNFSPPISFASPVNAPFSLPTTTAKQVLDAINDLASLQAILKVGNENVFVDPPVHCAGQQELNYKSVRFSLSMHCGFSFVCLSSHVFILFAWFVLVGR